MRVAELEAGRSSAVPALEAGLRSGPIRAAARRLRELIGEEGLVEDRPYLHPSSKAGVGQQCGDPTMKGNMLIPASVQDIAEHLRRAAKAVHPEEVAARGADAAGSLRRAVAMVAKWRNRTASARRRRLSELRSISRSLRSGSRRLMREFAPEHILEAEGAQRAHPALWAAVCSAFEMDPTLAIDAVLGVRPVGDVPSSGMFAQVEDDGAYASLDELDHDRWNTYLESDIRSRSLSGRVDARDVDAVFAACEKEVAAGHMHGYFSKEELDARFGVGAWRAIRRSADSACGRTASAGPATTARRAYITWALECTSRCAQRRRTYRRVSPASSRRIWSWMGAAASWRAARTTSSRLTAESCVLGPSLRWWPFGIPCAEKLCL